MHGTNGFEYPGMIYPLHENLDIDVLRKGETIENDPFGNEGVCNSWKKYIYDMYSKWEWWYST
jgi:hypothetical protein